LKQKAGVDYSLPDVRDLHQSTGYYNSDDHNHCSHVVWNKPNYSLSNENTEHLTTSEEDADGEYVALYLGTVEQAEVVQIETADSEEEKFELHASVSVVQHQHLELFEDPSVRSLLTLRLSSIQIFEGMVYKAEVKGA